MDRRGKFVLACAGVVQLYCLWVGLPRNCLAFGASAAVPHSAHGQPMFMH